MCITLVPESFSTLSLLGRTHAHQVQASILLSSCWDSLSGLVAPLWGGGCPRVPSKHFQLSTACTLCLLVYSSLSSRSELWIPPQAFSTGFDTQQIYKMGNASVVFCHVTHLQKYDFSGYIILNCAIGFIIYLTILFLL